MKKIAVKTIALLAISAFLIFPKSNANAQVIIGWEGGTNCYFSMTYCCSSGGSAYCPAGCEPCNPPKEQAE